MRFKSKATSFLVVALLVILSSCAPQPVPTSVTRATPLQSPSVPTPTHVAGPAGKPTGVPEFTPVPEPIDTRIRTRDGMVLVHVPAGQFEMGSNQDERAQPVHRVAVDAFWIDQTEVTNAMFTAFLNEQGNQAEEGVNWLEPGAGHREIVYGHIDENDGLFVPQVGYEDYPVVEVSWYGAAAYCSSVDARLPTEAEWEYAARGPQSLRYPWGNAFDGTRANYCDVNCTYDWRDTTFDDGSAQWTSVGSYPDGASWCGALDMAGNIWEWVSDWWSEDYYAQSRTDSPQGPDSGTLHPARGGSWFDEGRGVGVARRAVLTPSSYRMHWVGFRCVVPAQP